MPLNKETKPNQKKKTNKNNLNKTKLNNNYKTPLIITGWTFKWTLYFVLFWVVLTVFRLINAEFSYFDKLQII